MYLSPRFARLAGAQHPQVEDLRMSLRSCRPTVETHGRA
jgi:hypothetical protein